MPARRRGPRLVLVTPVEAVLVLQQPVTVDRFASGEMWVTSEFPAAQNELFNFCRVGSNPASNLRLRVANSEPVILEGAVKHRVRLTPAAGSVPAAGAVLGMLTKTIRVRLLEVAQTGCVFEGASRLEAGISGELHVDIDGERWSDEIRIRRSHARESDGRTVHVTAAEFVWARPFHDVSLRDVVGSRDDNASRVPAARRKTGLVH